jgi:hypothetical protein
MAAPTIPIRLGLISTGLAVEKLHWPALRRLADRYVVTAFTDRAALLARDDVEQAADFLALAAGHPDPIGRLHRLVPREGRFTWHAVRQRPQYRGGVHHIARVHGAVQAPTARSTHRRI